MKRLLIFTVGLLLSVSCYAGEVSHWYLNDDTDTSTIVDSYGSNDGTFHNGLISQWRMNSDWDDEYGSNDGTAHGATFDTNNQKVGSACGDFDGSDDYVDLYDMPSFNQISVGVWIYPKSSMHDSKVWLGNAIGYSGWMFYRDNQVYIGSGSDWIGVVNYSELEIGEWTHWMFTYDGTDLKAYENGNLVDTDDRGGGTISTSSIIARINNYESSWFDEYADARFDDVRIYNRALTSTEIDNIYNSGNGSETNEASVAIDNSVTGKINEAIDFDGSSDYVDIGDLGDPGSGSISLWFNKDNTDTEYLMDGRDTGNWYFLTHYDGHDLNFNSQVDFDGISLDTWYHVVVTANSSETKMYVNGNLEDTGSGLSIDFSSITIGTRFTQGFFFNGQIDDLRIYDHALTEREVKKLYHYTLGTERELDDIWLGQMIMVN